MGMGPHGTSLLSRVGGVLPVWSNPFSMQLEQQDRGEQRRLKAIWHAMKHKAPKKPEAPVEAMPKKKGEERWWRWHGESIKSKDLIREHTYTAAQLRKAGFKLPKLKKEGK